MPVNTKISPWAIAGIVVLILIIITAVVVPLALMRSNRIQEYSGPMFQEAGSTKITLAQQPGVATTLNFGFNTASQGNFPIPTFIPKDRIFIYIIGGEIDTSTLLGDQVTPPAGYPPFAQVYRSKQDYNNGFTGLNSTRKRESIIRFYY